MPITKYAWCTDTHLDHFNDDKAVVAFAKTIANADVGGVILTGDISVSHQLVRHLEIIEKVAACTVYFVCGNHDYYGASITRLREMLKEVSNNSEYLRYLPLVQYVPLSQTTALVGHDCWYDANYGGGQVNCFMNDWRFIQEFVQFTGATPENPYVTSLNVKEIVELSRKLAYEGMMHIMSGIKAAAKLFNKIIVVSHVPPYPNRVLDPDKFPFNEQNMEFYASKFLGDMLFNAAKTYPNVNFTVLCGHTHKAVNGNVAKNLEVKVGGAEYGKPKINEIIEVV